LLEDLSRCPEVAQVLVTQNIPEAPIPCPEPLRACTRFIRNGQRLGFGANHNQAFGHCTQPFYLVLNPDIRLLHGDPLPGLIGYLNTLGAAVAAPAVRNPEGGVEDSVRRFPTPLGILAKLLRLGDGRYCDLGEAPRAVDWAAGMFLLFRSEDFRALGGFDDAFFLYYEDVDLCLRLWKAGRRVLACPQLAVVHDARRASHRNLRYLKWHLASLARYFAKHAGRLPRVA